MIKGKVKLCCWYTCWKLLWFCCQKWQILANPLGLRCYSPSLCDWTECWPSCQWALWKTALIFLLSPCRHTSIWDGFTWAWREAWPVSVLACVSVILCAFKGMVHAKLTLMSFHICMTCFCETQGYFEGSLCLFPIQWKHTVTRGSKKQGCRIYWYHSACQTILQIFSFTDVGLYWIFICSC